MITFRHGFPKGKSKNVTRKKTDNTMSKIKKRTEGQRAIYKTLHGGELG